MGRESTVLKPKTACLSRQYINRSFSDNVIRNIIITFIIKTVLSLYMQKQELRKRRINTLILVSWSHLAVGLCKSLSLNENVWKKIIKGEKLGN